MIYVTKSDLPPIEEYYEYLKKIWDTHYVTNNGPYVQELEQKLENYLGIKNLLVVNNGTIAINMAIRGLELTGEIITTPFTFVATSSCILWEHCKPVFADIDPLTYNIDVNKIENLITDKTSAILAVHVFGNPCDVESLDRIAKKHNLKLIYDAAHAFGVEYNHKSIFNYGDISTLSFHATKVFHTIEGGAIVVNNDELYNKIKLMRNFGITGPDDIVTMGTNAKMNEFQAAMGLLNLKKIDENIAKRKKIFDIYISELSKLKYIKLQKQELTKYNYSYMNIVLDEGISRDSVVESLVNIGVMPRKYFYPMLGNLSFFENKNDLPIANSIANRVLCLPIYPTLDETIVYNIINVLENIQ